jgi:hypothetical protein
MDSSAEPGLELAHVADDPDAFRFHVSRAVSSSHP